MTDKKVAKETISKALAALQQTAEEAVSKGHSSRGTATTAVESMRDASVGAGSDAGSTQVHHTPSNSDPKGWAGSRASNEPDDGAHDSIDENGTDYNGVSHGLMKSIFNKLEKGEPLSEAEQFVLKSATKKGGKPAFMDKDEEDAEKGMDKDDDEDTKKSLSDYASENEAVSKGLEMSPFLAGWAQVQHESLQSQEDRIVGRILKSLKSLDNDNAEYQMQLAKSMQALAEVITLQSQRVEQIESTPARGPKSAQVVEKSFGPGGAASAGQGEMLQKSQILDTLVDMAKSQRISPTEVVKFESTGEINEAMYNDVLAFRSGQ